MLFGRQRYINCVKEHINNCKLTSGYTNALIDATINILDYDKINTDNVLEKPMNERLVIAQSKLRSARQKAKFDDLYKLNYESYEKTILWIHETMLLRFYEPRHRLLNDFKFTH